MIIAPTAHPALVPSVRWKALIPLLVIGQLTSVSEDRIEVIVAAGDLKNLLRR